MISSTRVMDELVRGIHGLLAALVFQAHELVYLLILFFLSCFLVNFNSLHFQCDLAASY